MSGDTKREHELTKIEEMIERIEQLECQLAGCMAAAMGWAKDPPKPGDWGWSASFQEVLELRRKYEALLAKQS